MITIAQRLGERLFGLIFQNSECLAAYHSICNTGNGLRLVLEFDLENNPAGSAVSKWATLPWEFLREPFLRLGVFCAGRGDFQLVRRLGNAQLQDVTVTSPLKVLAVFAEPLDQLPYRREEVIKTFIVKMEQCQVQTQILSQPTLPSLIQALADYKPHVLHIVAHGSFPGKMGGYLALEDAYGGTHIVRARDLAEHLRGSGVKLAMLSSSHSAGGLAQALVRTVSPL